MAKKLNVIGLVFMGLVAVGLILAIVGMCTGIVSNSATETSVGLFAKEWAELEKLPQAAIDAAEKLGITIPSRTFTLIAFIVTLVGAVALIVNGILGLLGKDIKILGLVAGAVTVVGAILILVAGLVLAGNFDKYAGDKGVISAGIGIWLGFIGGLIAGVAGLLSALKVGQKA